jgi:hypothetical protein
MFTTAQDALHWFRERGYPTPGQVVPTEPPLSEGLQQRLQEWARLVEIPASQGLPLHIYWVRLTNAAEQSQDAYRYLYQLLKQYSQRYPQYHALFVVHRKHGVSLMCACTTDGQTRVDSAPLSEDHQRLLEALQYEPGTPTEKHWQRILRAITGEQAMHPRIEQAFENFLAELNEILADAQEMIKRKAEEGCFCEITALAQQAEQIKQLVEEVKAFRERWGTQKSLTDFHRATSVPASRKHRRASPADINPQSAYARPLLQALEDLGGRAPIEQVLERVYQLVKSRLKPKDLEKVPSGQDLRWRNAAMWMRYKLKQQGYIKPDSPKGIWEITDAGREYLKQLQAEEAGD